MILICVSSLLIFFRYYGCFMVFKKEKSIMKEKESDQEGVIKVIIYGKCFISSKEFICTNILQTKIERLLNYLIIISFEEFQKKKKIELL